MTAEERDIAFYRALNSILALKVDASDGNVPADEMKDLEHRFWVLGMHAEHGEQQLKALNKQQPILMEAAE